MFVATPLEQFQIIPVCLFRIGFLDFSISNGTIIICFGLFFFVSIIYMVCNLDGNLHVVPSR